jgi:hypothetical protein
MLESLFEMDISKIMNILDAERKDVIRFADNYNSPEYVEIDKEIFRRE